MSPYSTHRWQRQQSILINPMLPYARAHLCVCSAALQLPSILHNLGLNIGRSAQGATLRAPLDEATVSARPCKQTMQISFPMPSISTNSKDAEIHEYSQSLQYFEIMEGPTGRIHIRGVSSPDHAAADATQLCCMLECLQDAPMADLLSLQTCLTQDLPIEFMYAYAWNLSWDSITYDTYIFLKHQVNRI